MPTVKRESPGKSPTYAAGSGGDAIAELHKALKASLFYPQNHPLRAQIMHRAFTLLSATMHGNVLSLAITRNGLSLAEGNTTVENTVAAKSLSKELFTREIQRLAFLPGLSLEEFEEFLSLLGVEPQKITAEGGMKKALSERGIRNVVTNEIDLSTVFTRKEVADSEMGEPSREIVETPDGVSDLDFLPLDELQDMELPEVIQAMKIEPDDVRYRQLAGVLVSKARELENKGLIKELLQILLFLRGQSLDRGQSLAKQECASATVGKIAGERLIEYMLTEVQDKTCSSRESFYQILSTIGEKVVGPAIAKLNSAGNINSRKALATVLVRIGRPSVPFLLPLLQDPRWYVVRGMLAILGEIGCKEYVKDLRPAVYHDDERVRKEAIRSLTKTGGAEASEVLIELLRDENDSVMRQVVFSLGVLKSDRAVEPLMKIIKKRDFFLKSLPLKKAAVEAVTVIGARRVLPQFVKLALKRHWLAGKRGEELQLTLISAIGKVGDELAVEFLRKMSTRSGAVGKASAEALTAMTK